MRGSTIYEDGTYLAQNQTWHEEDSPWKAKQIARMLQRNHITPSRICEIGCGAGETLNCLANEYGNGLRCYGYEISPQAFAICSKKKKENLHFFLKDPTSEGELNFDVLMAIDVFEHVEDFLGFLRKLKEKATFKIFHIPLDLSVQTVFRMSPILAQRSLVGHLHYFTKETALASLKDTGYEVVDCCYTNSAIELPNRSWKENLLKLPRKFFFSLNEDLTARMLGGFSLLVLAK